MVEYRCYIDKEKSTFFNQKLFIKGSKKKLILKPRTVSVRLNSMIKLLYISANKQVYGKDSSWDIIVTGTGENETKSAVFVSIGNKDEGIKLDKHKHKN